MWEKSMSLHLTRGQLARGRWFLMIMPNGGASKSPFIMQFQADIFGVTVKRPKISETTALGAAYLAGLGIGLWKDKDEIVDKWVLDKAFEPVMSVDERESKYSDWKRAVERSMKWARS